MVRVRRSPKSTPGKQKRWFAEASGWGLNLSLGSGESKPKSKRSLVTSTKSQFYNNSGSVAATAFLHNTIYTSNVMSVITQGTDVSNRVGKDVFVKAIHGTFQVNVANATANYAASSTFVRFMLVASTAQSSASAFTSGLGSSDIFFNSTSGSLLTARPDPRSCYVICDEILKVQPSVATSANAVGTSGITNVGCILNQHFEYRGATAYGTASNLYWIAIPYVTDGTAGTTQIASLNYDLVTDFEIV